VHHIALEDSVVTFSRLSVIQHQQIVQKQALEKKISVVREEPHISMQDVGLKGSGMNFDHYIQHPLGKGSKSSSKYQAKF